MSGDYMLTCHGCGKPFSTNNKRWPWCTACSADKQYTEELHKLNRATDAEIAPTGAVMDATQALTAVLNGLLASEPFGPYITGINAAEIARRLVNHGFAIVPLDLTPDMRQAGEGVGDLHLLWDCLLLAAASKAEG